MIIKVIALAALIKLLIATDKPILCSSIYTFVVFALGLLEVMVGNAPFLGLLIVTIICFGLSSLYFWLLYKIGEGGLWWIVFSFGLVILFV